MIIDKCEINVFVFLCIDFFCARFYRINGIFTTKQFTWDNSFFSWNVGYLFTDIKKNGNNIIHCLVLAQACECAQVWAKHCNHTFCLMRTMNYYILKGGVAFMRLPLNQSNLEARSHTHEHIYKRALSNNTINHFVQLCFLMRTAKSIEHNEIHIFLLLLANARYA